MVGAMSDAMQQAPPWPGPSDWCSRSTSRARATLLTQAGIEHELEASGVDESGFDEPTPEGLVSVLADAKARAVAARVTDALVLGCDSVLSIDGRVLGKPATAQAAREHWSRIAGRTATLLTGHTLLRVAGGVLIARAASVARTDVHVGRPTPSEIARPTSPRTNRWRAPVPSPSRGSARPSSRPSRAAPAT